MSMAKLIIHYSNFFCSGHFLTYFSDIMDQKMTGAKKSYLNKKSVLSCLSTSQRFFLVLFMHWLYFHDWFLKLYEASAKLCDLGGRSYLDKKCSPCLCLPPVWCTKLGMKYGNTLLSLSMSTYKKNWKSTEDFGKKPQFSPKEKNFLDIWL